ncbi:hypothetical protein AK830_g3215 [Neonectria ditissima]|uniref:Shugoshin n=1 Tax=Neonectria ditissima TaxID=78410 RepID=A0A0P7AZY6_9HYPO|nr:hypothetical protein AK830_g3215 [Neonectria ditissima]
MSLTTSHDAVRKKLMRQNRDLAKSNNVRALRIRELENDCACMLSENLELRGRILELERELENNDTSRIADHALAIKEKLESQLTEWGALLAGLGVEPPTKRHSPQARRTSKPRLSFSSQRPSPSQRRLRDIARDIEELGHISETKSYPRMSMDPEQILALRSEASSVESPELGPPPMSQFIDEDPVKVDSPSRPCPAPAQESPKNKMEPPVALESPQRASVERPPSPEKKEEIVIQAKETKETKPKQPVLSEISVPQSTKTGSKRKLAVRDEVGTSKPQRINNENQDPTAVTEKQSIREKAGGRTLKELASIRKEARGRTNAATTTRKPLAAKSTNDDITSPKKTSSTVITDEIAIAKADLIKSKASLDRPKSKTINTVPIMIEAVVNPQPPAPKVTDVSYELGTPVTDITLLSPSSPETVVTDDGSRGATPPPPDINSSREPTRPSRRGRVAVSYAEPNLRDKMRRPTKELYDAVAGEGKNARRASQAEPPAPDSVKVKREMDIGASWKKLPPVPTGQSDQSPDNIPASPSAGRGSPPLELRRSAATEKGRRSSILVKETTLDYKYDKQTEDTKDEPPNPDSSNMSEVDLYEFTPSSPQPEKQADPEVARKTGGRRASRRVSSAVTNEDGLTAKERASSRRRSMML